VPVCDPGSLPGFVGTVTTVTRPGVTRRKAFRAVLKALEIPHLVDSPPPPASPGASSWKPLPPALKGYDPTAGERPPAGNL
jgi:hypothetical protein